MRIQNLQRLHHLQKCHLLLVAEQAGLQNQEAYLSRPENLATAGAPQALLQNQIMKQQSKFLERKLPLCR